jgi:hypothetical protein
MEEAMKQEEILGTIRAARDSVWVIEDSIEKLTTGADPTKELYDTIERNVSHLKLVVSNQEIIDSDEDITDLEEAILIGETKLNEDIWTF